MRFLLVLILCALALPTQAAPLQVVASFSVLADLVAQVGGPEVTVSSLVGPDGDAHAFQPTPQDAQKLKQADLVFVNGFGLEGWLDRLITASGSKAPVITATAGITPRSMQEGGQPVPDPHAWQDLHNGEIYVRNIAAALEARDAPHADLYKQRAAALTQELAALDGWVRQQVATVPADKRVVISSHDAFGYFAAAYGIRFLAPVGLSTEEEPSAAALKKLAQTIRTGKVHALFLENMADGKVVKQLGSETGVALGGQLYADALSSPNGSAPTYQAMFRHNVPQLVAGMQKND